MILSRILIVLGATTLLQACSSIGDIFSGGSFSEEKIVQTTVKKVKTLYKFQGRLKPEKRE